MSEDVEHTPKRIQRKRTTGWKMPFNAIYVGRPTKFGNPFKIGESGNIKTRDEVIKAYESYLQRLLIAHPDFVDELRGKDLACWCPLDKPCHADVLLRECQKIMANTLGGDKK